MLSCDRSQEYTKQMGFCLFQQVCRERRRRRKRRRRTKGWNGSTATELAHTEGEYFTGRVSRVQDSEGDTQRGRLHKDNHYLTSSSLLWNRCFVFKSRLITSDCLPIIVLILWQRKPFWLNLCMLEMRKNPWLWGTEVCCSPSSPCHRHRNRNRQNMETDSEKCLMISTRMSA